MNTRNIYIGWMVIALLLSTLACTNSEPAVQSDLPQPVSQTDSVQVVIRAQSGETIEFQTQNGLTRNGVAPEVYHIPRLILFHNNTLTEAPRRTLLVELNKEEGAALIVVTHSTELAQLMDKVYTLKNGKLEVNN